MSVVKKIYVFFSAEKTSLYHFKAVAEDGTCLAQHHSHSEDSAKSDMRTPEKMSRYQRHYPNGFTLVWRGGPIDIAASQPKSRVINGSAQFFQAKLDHEFGEALKRCN